MQTRQPDFISELRTRGFKATPLRAALLQTLWKAKKPLTVDEIGRKIDGNVVSVYRALNDLHRAGVIARGVGAAGVEGDLRGDIRASHFSYARMDHHHHLVCTDCGFSKDCAVCV